jgi:hypothetical protein
MSPRTIATPLATGLMALATLSLAACGSDTMATSTTTPPPVASATPTPTPAPTPTATATSTPVSANVISALNASLDDERKAVATYEAIIAKLGPVAPFENILAAERRHVESLLPLYTVRGLDIPDDIWAGNGTAADTVQENCALGVIGEIDNIAMYDNLIASLTADDQDIIDVFLVLQAASRDNHLPAFQACA